MKNKDIELVFCGSQEQVVDILTKPLNAEMFHKFMKKMGMQSMNGLSLRGGDEI